MGDYIELHRKKHELLEFLCMRNRHKVDGAVPVYLIDHETTTRAKENTLTTNIPESDDFILGLFWWYLGVVLYVLNVIWIDNSTGFGKSFIDAVSTISDSHEIVMLSLTFIFAIVHSGLASLRDKGVFH
ncbi:hypothetical protein K7X08_014011 [Anisodus acutangulus]|uniref:Uncharacterized protein n=1 Tax=Anisodus acutangulus TaxID=402998 RepID=A0A9Q1LNC9_9SOLA|nr:hypothetical protein K7X08_014011 [Anisodus acutangulus]